MNSLVEALVKPFLEAEGQKTVAIYPGKFKPPHKGHFNVAKELLSVSDEIIVLISPREVDGVSASQSKAIWELYKKQLGDKVTIQISQNPSPVSATYDIIKADPTDNFIAAFGKNEADRFKSLEGKYPNVKIMDVGTTEGLNASDLRKLLAADPTQNISRYLPDGVDQNEYKNILNSSVKEEKIPGGMSSGKTLSDLAHKYGISLDIAEKFLKKGIAIEMEHTTSKAIAKEIAMDHLWEDIKYYIKLKKAHLEESDRLGIKAFSRELALQKEETESSELEDNIKAIIRFLITKGLNMMPFPQIKIIADDVENSKNLFGKTAYYDPENKVIVLYTYGRHQIDIIKSFLHELEHHIQNLEGRINNINTTNILEDDNLKKLEEEAYLFSGMAFREWRDSSKQIQEQDQAPTAIQYAIYQDMDGCLTDFDAAFKVLSDGIPPAEFEKSFGKNKFWHLIDKAGIDFWSKMPWMPDGKQLWDYIKKYNPTILSAPSRQDASRIGKKQWLNQNLPGVPVVLAYRENKQNYARPSRIIIDDNKQTCDEWRAKGGIAIQHVSAQDTIKQLQQLGL